MSKELEALEKVYYGSQGYGDCDENYKIVKQALLRLEAIDNANPSEALKIFNKVDNIRLLFTKEEKSIIKQALLKAQEPKQYLKWEDLEFDDKEQRMDVSLNGHPHLLCYYRTLFGSLCMIDNTGITIREDNKYFFNDLHLERVEE